MAQLLLTGNALTSGSCLEPALQVVERRLGAWASSSNSAAYNALLLQIFGVQSSDATSALQASLSGTGLGISLDILAGATLSGINGTYTSPALQGGERIDLHQAWLQSATAADIEAVLLTQIGHAIGYRLKGADDTTGDEVAIFSAQLRGENPGPAAYSENDLNVITLPNTRRVQSHSGAAANLVHELLGVGLGAAKPTVCRCSACSRLFVVDTGTSTSAGAGLSAASLGLDLTFRLHSNPTANQRIYLDFDGYYLASSEWEDGAALQVGAFYGVPGSDAAQQAIQDIWRRVAEDFAPFNIDITTEAPNSDDLKKSDPADSRWGIRVAMTTNANLITNAAIKNAGGGGTAYMGSFNWATDEVCLVFNGYNDTSTDAIYAAAETVSHEVGHSLGLSHDGGSYGSDSSYYEGHGSGDTSWGTIMGAPFINANENVTTWSKGDYLGANNPEDDLGIITGSVSNTFVSGNGFSYRVDDYGDSLATAYTLSGTAPSSFGIIERSTDVDWFRFSIGAASVSLSIRNACRVFSANGDGTYSTQYLDGLGPNLDISAQLFDANGVLIATNNPLDRLDASFSLSLAEGDYYLSVEGVGFGTPLANPPSGYTDYGSLGQYLITTSILPAESSPPILTGITVQGNQLLLQFSEAITTTGLQSSRFGISVAGVTTAVSTISAGSDNTQLLLTLSGTAPTSAQTVTLSYTDLTTGDDSSGVIQNLSGNDLATISPAHHADTFSSSANVTTLAATYSNLILRGTASSGSGNTGNNNIRVQQSTAVANLLTGGSGTDTLDGAEGSDIYVIASSLDHTAAEISDTGAAGTDELRFSSITAGQTLSVYAADTGLEQVTIGTGTAAAAVLTATTALNVNASAAANGLILTGNAGANSITGTAFVDIITGNAGNDVLDGGNSGDLYLIASSTDRSAAEIKDTGSEGSDELRFSSSTAGQTLTVYAAETGLELVTIGTGNAAVAVVSATTALHVDASLAANALTIKGNAGANVITGSGFVDSLDGRDGGDLYVISTSSQHTAAEISDSGAAGTDELRFSSSTAGQTLSVFAADTGIELVTIGTGTAAAAVLTATTALNVNASAAANGLTILGNAGVNNINGTAFVDIITGNAGNDSISGGLGNDILSGGLGADTFRFDTTPDATTNVDSITDFSTAGGDSIQLENAVYTALTTTGTLATTAFANAATASTTAQRILYNSVNGQLLYDSDGSGSNAAVQFATLTMGLALTNTQFKVT